MLAWCRWRRSAGGRGPLGWFTVTVSDGCLGVVAVGIASEHSARGEAVATAYVGLRDDAVERIICQLCDVNDDAYQQRTVVSAIGYLMPGRGRCRRAVDGGGATRTSSAGPRSVPPPTTSRSISAKSRM